MIQIYPDTGLEFSLQKILNNGTGLYWFLFNNNVTPGFGSTLSTFVPETNCSPLFWNMSGSAAFTLQGLAGHVWKATGPDLTFANLTGSPLTEYGYFVCDAISGSTPLGNLVLATLFDGAPLTIPATVGTLNVTPTLSLKASS